MTAARPRLLLVSTRPLRADDQLIVFSAREGDELIEIRLTPALWEHLQAEAPLPADAADRRDHALGEIEARASAAWSIAESREDRTIFLG